MLPNVKSKFNTIVNEVNSLADELLEQSQVKLCRVNMITDFFPELKSFLSPLSEEAMRAQSEDRFFLPVIN